MIVFKNNSKTLKGMTAEEVRDELVKIQAKSEDNKLYAQDVVESASNTSSPLHDYFEWDDHKAAHHHRILQAAKLIKIIRIKSSSTSQQSIPVFYHVQSKKKEDTKEYSAYQQGSLIVKDDLKWKHATNSAYITLRNACIQIEDLCTLTKNEDRIRELRERLREIVNRINNAIDFGKE